MENDLVKRFIKKDGSQRISFYRDEYAENPRDMTDEPFHCQDWSREYTIMNTQERASCNRSSSASSLLVWCIRNFADHKKVLKVLFENGKHMNDGYAVSSDALVYNKSTKEWEYMCCGAHYNYETKKNEKSWYVYKSFYCKKDEIDVYDVIDSLEDDTINYLIGHCMTDNVKLASYGFGYNGDISFYDEVTCDSEGICWLEKDEFLKYSGCKEEYWTKSLEEIEFLLGELKAWSDNEVYGFVVEDCIKSKVHKEYTNVDKEDEDYEEEEWEESNSCWGFYGEFDKSLDWMFESAGLKQEEFEEE